MWDVHTYGNDFLGFTVWDVHKNRKDWACIIVSDASPDRTRAHFAPASALGGPIPDGFRVVWEGPPIAHTHLATVPNTVTERG